MAATMAPALARTADQLTQAVFAELAVKRTRRAAELIAEAIRLARPQEPRAEITGSQWQASTEEVRNWARRAASSPAPTAASRNRPSRPTNRPTPTAVLNRTRAWELYLGCARRLTASGPDPESWDRRSFGINKSAEMGAAGQCGGGATRVAPGPAGHEARSSALLGEFGKECGAR